MSILYTITAYPPAIGGAQLHLHEFAKHVQQRYGTGVIYHWNTNRTDWLNGTTIDAPAFFPPPAPDILDGVPTYPMWVTEQERRQAQSWVRLYWLMQTAAIRHISDSFVEHIIFASSRLFDSPPDIVHNSRVGREGLTIASLRYARSRGIPFVFTPNHHAHWRGWLYRHYTEVFRSADAVIVHTSYEADELTRLGVSPKRLTVIGVGPILAELNESPEVAGLRFRAQYAIPNDAPIVLFLGQKYLYKRFDLILKAMPDVWKSQPETRFVFIGPRTDDSRRIFASTYDTRVIELDIIDIYQKTDAIAACSLLCMPSHRESFGGVYLEAWMLNKPVIGGDAPAIHDLIVDGVNGYTVDYNPEKLARQILQLLNDPALSSELGAAGRRVASRYSWDSLSDCLLEVYQHLL